MRMNLKLLRTSLGLTQDGMARRLGISRTQYNKIENGRSAGSIEFWLTVKREFPHVEIEEITKGA